MIKDENARIPSGHRAKAHKDAGYMTATTFCSELRLTLAKPGGPYKGYSSRLMNILPYKLDTTTDKLTSRAGLLVVGQLMDDLSLCERVDSHFPLPKSNRGFKPSTYIQTFMLMQHEGGFHLDDVRHVIDDKALRTVMNLKTIPQASSLGGWLRKMGANPASKKACTQVNKVLLQSALHNRKAITLDIDATEIVSDKKSSKWTYKKNKGFMPMVGHVAETGQVVACDFREGNAAPASENFEFIKQCEDSLPEGCFVQALRIDSAGYQEKVIRHCDKNNIQYAIRAKMYASLRKFLESLPDDKWQPFLDKKGNIVEGQETYRTSHCIGKYEKPFILIVQRKKIQGQVELDLDIETPNAEEEISMKGYVYRSIATNRDDWDNNDLIRWYNQRAEDSENRLKELKCDFGGDTLPCSDFKANALYFSLCALSFNLFALMRHLLPEELAHHRAVTLRWRLYSMAAKVVRTGRQLYVKLRAKHHDLLERVLIALKEFEPPPI